MKVFISTTSFGEYDRAPLKLLEKAGAEVMLNPYRRKLTEAEAKESLKDIDALIAGTEALTRGVLQAAKKLRVISRCGTGMENVDLKACAELKIKIFNTPDAPTKAVAELTVGLILDCLRSISMSDREVRSGKWNKIMGELLGSGTVGIIGFGRIGKEVARIVLGFGAKVIAFDRERVDPIVGVELVSFDEVITRADIISLHVPKGPAGPMVDAGTIGKMKDGAYIINAARGGLIDEQALFTALKSKKLAGAALDTFGAEPYKGDLLKLDNVILTPHIGSYAKSARIEMETQAVKNLLKGMEGLK